MNGMLFGVFITLVLTFVESLCVAMLYEVFLRQKRSDKWYGSAAAFSITVSLCYVLAHLFLESINFPFNSLIAIILIEVIVSSVFYKGPTLLRLAMPFCFGLLQHVIDNAIITLMCNYYNIGYQRLISGDIITFLLTNAISHLVLFFLCLCVRKIFGKQPIDNLLSWKLWAIILYAPIITICTVLVLVQSDTSQVATWFLSVTSLGLLFLSFVILYVISMIMAKEKEVRERILLKQQNALLMENVESLKGFYSNERSFVHDSINQMTTAYQLIGEGKPQAAHAYLGKKIGQVKSLSSHAYTGNEMVDTVISQKVALAKSQDIEILVHSEYFDTIPMDIDDLLTILYNALDNAIEASIRVAGQKTMKLKLKKEPGMFIISVVNPYVGEITIRDNHIETTKKDKEAHGIGLTNVGNVLAKYGTSYQLFAENGRFQFTAIINY